MSRRNSRSNPIEYDPLAEFEAFKKNYLLINKHITKINSSLNLKIDELNGQLNCLCVENLRLRTLNISLMVQLKQEKEKSSKILEETEFAATHLVKHLAAIRDSFISSDSPLPAPLSSSPVRPPVKRPATAPEPRISKKPMFSLIHEEDSDLSEDFDDRQGVADADADEEDEDEDEQDRRRIAMALSFERPHSSLSHNVNGSRLPRPVPSIPVGVENGNVNPSATLSPGWARRQSGLMRPPSPSPGSPIAAVMRRVESAIEEEEAEAEGGEAESEAEVEEELVSASLHLQQQHQQQREEELSLITPSPSPTTDFAAAASLPTPQSPTRSKFHPQPPLSRTMLTGATAGGKLTSTTKLQGQSQVLRRTGLLKDVTNNNMIDRILSSSAADDTSLPTPPLSAPPQLTGAPASNSISISMPALSVGPTSSEDNETSGGGRRSRATRKSINYAEPSLKTKMRKRSPSPTSSRRSSVPRRKSMKGSAAGTTTDDDETDAEDTTGGGRNGHGRSKSINGVAVVPPVPKLPASSSVSVSSQQQQPPQETSVEGRRHSNTL